MTKTGMRNGAIRRRRCSYSAGSPRSTRSPVITAISGSGSSRLIASTARDKKPAVSTGPNPAGVRGAFPGSTMCGSDSWATIIGIPLRSAPRSIARLTRQHKDALLGQEIGEAAARIERERAAMPVERDAALDLCAELVAQHDKIADRAEVNVGGVVPRVVQQFRHRHAAAPQQAAADTPEAEIRE